MRSIRLMLLALLALSGPARAVNFNMTCTVGNASLVLNAYDAVGTTTTAALPTNSPAGSVTVSCTSTHPSAAVTVNYMLQLSLTPARTMSNGTDNLSYTINTDAPAGNGLSSVRWGTTGTCAAGSNVNAGEVICGSFSVPAKSTLSHVAKQFYVNAVGGSDISAGPYSQVGAIPITLNYSCTPAPTGGGAC